jgi:hypothetical protein
MDMITRTHHQESTSASEGFEDYFKIRTRTNRLLGLWAAELMGLSRESAAQYVEDLLMLELKGGDYTVMERIQHDLSKAHVMLADSVLEAQAEAFWRLATEKMTAH